ncbi:MAG: DUF5677 domain-containing protein [Dyella sp.]
MTDSNSLLDHAEAILTSVKELIGKMRAPLSIPERPRVALFLTIAEQFESAIRLGRAGMGTHGAVHVRSMLEALVSMNMLAMRLDYVDQMRFEKFKGEKKLYESLLKNHDLPDDQKTALQARLTQCKASYDALFAKGIRPKKITDDFSSAGLAEFIAPYTILCSLSHNDLVALATRHQGETGMTYKAVVADNFMQSIYSVAMTAMMTAAKPLGEIARFNADGHFFEHLFQGMNQVWGSYLQSVGAK